MLTPNPKFDIRPIRIETAVAEPACG